MIVDQSARFNNHQPSSYYHGPCDHAGPINFISLYIRYHVITLILIAPFIFIDTCFQTLLRLYRTEFLPNRERCGVCKLVSVHYTTKVDLALDL